MYLMLHLTTLEDFQHIMWKYTYVPSSDYIRVARCPEMNWRVRKSKSPPGKTRSSAIAEGLREALVSRNPATTKHLT